MSTARGVPGGDGPEAGEKIVLPRAHKELWKAIELHWAHSESQRWRALAMVHLHVHCGWTVTMVARAFALHKGQVSRRIHSCQNQLREIFEVESIDGAGAEELQADDVDGSELSAA